MLVCMEKVRTYLHDAKCANVNDECLRAKKLLVLWQSLMIKVTGFWLDRLTKSVLYTAVSVPREKLATHKKLGRRSCRSLHPDGLKTARETSQN